MPNRRRFDDETVIELLAAAGDGLTTRELRAKLRDARGTPAHSTVHCALERLRAKGRVRSYHSPFSLTWSMRFVLTDAERARRADRPARAA